MEKPFAELFGQINVKKRLNFYLKAFEKTSLCPFLLLVGAKGLGKTEFARQFGGNLKNLDGRNRSFLELNCSTIKNLEGFFDQIHIPLIMDSEITVLFDEAHELPKDVTNAFLTISLSAPLSGSGSRHRLSPFPLSNNSLTSFADLAVFNLGTTP